MTHFLDRILSIMYATPHYICITLHDANLIIDVLIHLNADSVFGPLSGKKRKQRPHLGGLEISRASQHEVPSNTIAYEM